MTPSPERTVRDVSARNSILIDLTQECTSQKKKENKEEIASILYPKRIVWAHQSQKSAKPLAETHAKDCGFRMKDRPIGIVHFQSHQL
jgi:hypothetical protein